ncbi:AcrR family transcriptional regulator [Saccharomonospora amisosensis]|uniref:AcrR family transcriptional regulator n=1 Tax=Saccharomonospora amisosensis TaxID=1128677 RepID=A0A7X5UQC2_9PSEU|nr:TetR/AcrR family transcriptional regulator [Saccharomonospora amisosensis]NIJ11774.1 AcrR family transcriptional regulator [Saccharomonospora amisosensis]
MSPRVGLSADGVVDAALALVDERGTEALTLANVAARTGVATPSLYKHVGGLAELRALVGVRILDEMTTRFSAVAVGRGGDAAVAALMREYRAYVLDHPKRYPLTPMDPLHDPVQREAGTRLLQVMLAALREYGLEGADAVHATRRLRVVVHGFASIEAAGGFGLPEALDETYEQLIDMYLASLRRT